MRRLLVSCLSALAVSACSMEAMEDKLIPDDVSAEVDAQIDRLVAGETGFIFDAFPDDATSPDFRAQIERMVGNVPDAEEVSRDVVGLQAATEQAYTVEGGAVRSGTYNMAHELAFDDGTYLLVQTAHTMTDAGECCALRAINASRHDTSPVKAQRARQAAVMKIVALLLLLTTLATAAFLIIRVGGRKARAAQMGEG